MGELHREERGILQEVTRERRGLPLRKRGRSFTRNFCHRLSRARFEPIYKVDGARFFNRALLFALERFGKTR